LETEIAVTRYLIDKRTSRFTVRAFASGMLSAFGHNPVIDIRDLTGEAGFSPESPENGYLRMRIKADSLQVAGEVSSKDLREMERMMREEVLEVSKYPEIVYESTGTSASQLGEGRYRVEVAGKPYLARDDRASACLGADDNHWRYAPCQWRVLYPAIQLRDQAGFGSRGRAEVKG
jgi:hypothetical protein